MNSMKTMGRWLTIGVFCFTALLGCEDEKEKAEGQADKATGYIKEQIKLSNELYSDYKFLISGSQTLSKSELTKQNGILGWMPSCVVDADRPIIKTKLARVVALSEAIQKILATEKVVIERGDPAVFEHRKQNANSMLEELPNIPTCEAGQTPDTGSNTTLPEDSDDPWDWDKTGTEDDSSDATPTRETTEETLNRTYSEIDQLLIKLREVNIGIFRNQDQTLEYFRDDEFSFLDKPKCLSINASVTAEGDLAMVEAKISIINTLLSTEKDMNFDGDLDQLPHILNNVQVFLDYLPEIPVCDEDQ